MICGRKGERESGAKEGRLEGGRPNIVQVTAKWHFQKFPQ